MNSRDPFWNTYALLGTVGMALGAYHGYRRNQSVGWAVAWGALGAAFPFITVPVALAQGFGKPAVPAPPPQLPSAAGGFR